MAGPWSWKKLFGPYSRVFVKAAAFALKNVRLTVLIGAMFWGLRHTFGGGRQQVHRLWICQNVCPDCAIRIDKRKN